MVDLLQEQACRTGELVDRRSVLRQQLPCAAEQRWGLRWAKGSGLGVPLLLRIGELAALDTSDVAVSARKGLVTVRRGKGNRYRQVPLNTDPRDALDAWLTKRTDLPGNDSPSLLLSLKGQRLSPRAIDLTVRRLAQHADLQASAHTLRHICLTQLVRAGNDTVLVAELAGHTRLETTHRYSLPSPADRQAAMDTLTIDY